MANANPDISALAAYAADYRQSLFSKLYNSFSAAKDLTLIENVKHKLNLTKLVIKNGPKPGTGDFKPKADDIGYVPRVLTVEPWQRDLIIKPSKYRTTFMADMRGRGENPNNKTIPFAPYTWGKVIEQLAAMINNRTIYFGVGIAAFATFNSGSTYAVGNKIAFTDTDGEITYWEAAAITSAGQTPLTHPAKWTNRNAEAIAVGFAPKIADGITSGDIVPVTTGAVTTSSGAYNQFKKMWRSQSEAQREIGCPTFCSYTDFDILCDDFEDKVSKYTEKDNGIVYLSGTGRKNPIIACTWLSGSRRLITTPKENMLIGTDIMSDFNTIATEEHVYTLDAALSGVLGMEIQDFEAMRVSDQA